MSDRKTTADIRAHKNRPAPLVCLTAYTARIAQLLDPHCDLLLVGDSMGMVLYGRDSTRDIDLDTMIRHGRAVVDASRQACVIVDMPFGTYEHDPQDALTHAQRVMRETGCGGVKLEGGADMAATVKLLVDNGIPVVGHIGLMPQSVTEASGFKVQGKTSDSQDQLLHDARAIEAAGASAIVIEATIESAAAAITGAITIPTIGIGASAACDGQILVTEDMLGITGDHTPKFVKQYAHLSAIIEEAVIQYAQDVRRRAFPGEAQLYKKKAS